MISKSVKIAVIGLGMIGGSYVSGLNSAGYSVVGIDIDDETIRKAKDFGWIVEGGSDPALVGDCDIVISALYPTAFIKWIEDNQKYIKSGAIITDVTGVKSEIIKRINEVLRDDLEYIAAHPMAGTEYKGIDHANADEFLRANYIIVPTKENTQKAIDVAYDIAMILRFKRIEILEPDEHDKIIGFVSQLCHVIAVSIMNLSDDPKISNYTGDSFRDLTRIANINEDLWPELFIWNKKNLTSQIDALIDKMQYMRDLIETENKEEMSKMMVIATERRQKFDVKQDRK